MPYFYNVSTVEAFAYVVRHTSRNAKYFGKIIIII